MYVFPQYIKGTVQQDKNGYYLGLDFLKYQVKFRIIRLFLYIIVCFLHFDSHPAQFYLRVLVAEFAARGILV
jgi:hypothetical protein